jgi:hypothetical protein
MEVHPGMDTPRRQGMFNKNICSIYPPAAVAFRRQLQQLDNVLNSIIVFTDMEQTSTFYVGRPGFDSETYGLLSDL